MSETSVQYYEVDTPESLAEKLERYRDMLIEAQPTLDALKSLENEIREHVLETGEVAEVEGASVSIRNGYTKSTWDNAALRGYALANPGILQFCKQSPVKPSAVIKVEK